MNVSQVVDKLLTSGTGAGLAGGLASGLLVSSLSSKKRRKLAGSAAKIGGAALVGGLAWKAYDNYRRNNESGQTPDTEFMPTSVNTRGHAVAAGNPSTRTQGRSEWSNIRQEEFEPTAPAKTDQRDLLILRSMIAAACADGHMDTSEKSKIFHQLEALNIDPADKSLLFDEFLQPLSLSRLVAQVPNPAMAAEVYLATLMTIEPDSRVSVDYLDSLAEALSIPDELRVSLHAEALETQDLRSELPGKQTYREERDMARSA